MSPKDGRDGARPSNMEGHGPSWPRAQDGIKWRATLCHGRLLFGNHTGQTARP